MKFLPQYLYGGLLSSLLVVGIDVATAADDTFYESLPEVSIGKVFFSPQQRMKLDQRRGSDTDQSGAATAKRKPRLEKDSGDAAGFIISSNGGARVYSNGDFVSARSSDAVVFPNAVKVVRGERDDKPGASDAGD
mgnify:CR=1 FL=1|tara:strand:- start:8983 stop:9387 length:405 start_codon:yes stop_codon:yes gene_type:complete